MHVLACGLNHKTASIELREQLSFSSEKLHQPLIQLVDEPHIKEASILSTCNRTEIYCDAEKPEQVINWLSRWQAVDKKTLLPHFYAHRGPEAIRHMMRVASGLDSMVLGEPQIFGQMKKAYHLASKAGTIGNQLNHIFPRIFSASKQIRSQTKLGVHPVSVAYAAVDLAKHMFADLSQATVLLIGAGSTIELAARHCYQSGVRHFFIANRKLENARFLVDQVAGKALTIAQIPTVLAKADIIITATASSLPLLGKGAIEQALRERKHKSMCLIDLAVPRDIEPQVAQLSDVFLYNIDDLKNIIASHWQERQNAAKEAEQIIESQLAKFIEGQRSQRATQHIQHLREQLKGITHKEKERALIALQQGKSADAVLNELTHRLLNKFAHQPCVALRQASIDGREDLLRLYPDIFGIQSL